MTPVAEISCAFDGEAAALRELVAERAANGLAVVVAVPRSDRGAATRDVGGLAVVVELRAPDGDALESAAARVFAVDGRCVVLARQVDGGWDVFATSGADPASAPPRPFTPDDPPRLATEQPSDPELSRGLWVGGGIAVGAPELVAGVGRLQSGVFYAEVRMMPLMFVNVGSMRAGALWHFGGSESRHVFGPGLVAGVSGGNILFDNWSGPSGGLVVDWMRRTGPRSAAFLQLGVGADRWRGPRGRPSWEPYGQISYGWLVAPP